jgi:hypothetical protein
LPRDKQKGNSASKGAEYPSLSDKDFKRFVEELFAAPKKGTERMMLTAGRMWRFRQGLPGSLEIREDDGETWRTPTDAEFKTLPKEIRGEDE